MADRTTITCNYCGGSEILKDAYTEWDGEKWVLHSVYDHTICETCDGETSVTEITQEIDDV